ncbi:unnamed protein product [Closterium sp. NIES-65]|nr:unnamed protein product [Closterium sp. NIES-65]
MLGKSDKAKRADTARAAPIQGACVRFSLADMLTATNRWAPQLLVGDGYRLMFRGVDPRDGATPWLLKRCRAREFDEFHAEVTEMGNKNHPNLVRLLGYCDEQDKQGRWEKVVVYESMPAGSLLDQFQPGCSGVPLTLQQRLGILIGVAHGLEYLHSFGILHRCLCLRSVFLDGSMQAKIAGFDYVTRGAAGGGEHAVVGVRGYVDPQLLLSQEHTPTNDLYSLVRLARVGLACTAMPSSTRPSLGRVIAELEIVRDDVATALRQMEKEVERQEGELQGEGVAVAGHSGNEHLDSWANPSHADPLSTSPNPSTPPSQLPPSPPPVAAPSSSSALPLAPLLCQQVAMADVLRATAGWAAERRIGSGGFGDVYRGINEMASKHHPNLVRLLGFCMDYDAASERMEQIAIYEFMPNGDLYHHMHAHDTGISTPLTLQQRLDILIGVARALEYLHSFGIVHRDIKPANILLDAHMQASVCADGHLMRSQHAGDADVYSFGVVMMELLTCKHVVLLCEDGSQINIKDWVEQEVARGDSASVVNGDLNAPHAMASNLVAISLSCVAKLISNRPSMSHVLAQLEALRRELMGGTQERVARQLDAKVQQGQMKRNANAAPPSPHHRMSKRQRNAIIAKEKLQWLKMQGSQPDLSNRALAKLANVQPCQIREWKKMRERLEVVSSCRRRLMGHGRKSKYPFIERAVYCQFLKHRARGLAVTVSMLQKWSAKYMKHRMPGVNWRASFRWANRFRARWHFARRVKTKMGQNLAAVK